MGEATTPAEYNAELQALREVVDSFVAQVAVLESRIETLEEKVNK